MGKIHLYQCDFIDCSDKQLVEFEADDISCIKSPVLNDDIPITHFFLAGVGKQSCCNSPAEVKKLVEENRTKVENGLSIGSVHIGDQVHQNGLVFWMQSSKVQIGIIAIIAASVVGTIYFW